MTFVRIDDDRNDRFYILPWERLRDLLADHHEAYLAKHDGTRPKKWDSLHCAIAVDDLEPYRDKWDTIEKNLR